jgi:hypothetical protein
VISIGSSSQPSDGSRSSGGSLDFAHAGEKLTRHIYDYVITDSRGERDFVTELDNALQEGS